MTYCDVEFSEDTSDSLQGDDTNVYQQCEFCGKETLVYPRVGEMTRQLLKSNRFYCSFCIRNDFHTKKRNNILVVSFRGVIAYLYYHCYMVKEPTIYLAQIEDIISNHVQAGMLNPAFHYDPETYLWFVDFYKVGNHGVNKIALDHVLNTINDVLSVFNLYRYGSEFKGHKLAAKFEEAIVAYYNKRQRPSGKRILAPTLANCVDTPTTAPTTIKKCNIVEYRDFLPRDLKLHPRR